MISLILKHIMLIIIKHFVDAFDLIAPLIGLFWQVFSELLQ